MPYFQRDSALRSWSRIGREMVQSTQSNAVSTSSWEPYPGLSMNTLSEVRRRAELSDSEGHHLAAR